jgi:hypothetical protein
MPRTRATGLRTGEAERRSVWVCDGCGKVSLWGEEWTWYGCENDIDAGEPVTAACSEPCQAAAQAAYRPRKYKRMQGGYTLRVVYAR